MSRLFEAVLRESVMTDAEKTAAEQKWANYIVFNKNIKNNLKEVTYESFECMVFTRPGNVKVYYAKKINDDKNKVAEAFTVALQKLVSPILKVSATNAKATTNIVPLLDDAVVNNATNLLVKGNHVDESLNLKDHESKAAKTRVGKNSKEDTRKYGIDDMATELFINVTPSASG